MIYSDMHNHTSFSGDCNIPMNEMIKAARKKGLKYMAITEHHDLDFPYEAVSMELDIPSYIQTIQSEKNKITDDFKLFIGIEFGMQRHLYATLDQIAKDYPFDFIVGSNHLAYGKDPYDPHFFDGLTRNEGYQLFFEDTLYNATHFNSFDTLAHLDYVIRYWRSDDNKKIQFREFSDVLDAILEILIKKDKALEVNTGGYIYKLNQPHPAYDILQRYHELGGELLTIGSDAHRPENLSTHFDVAEMRLKQIGFKSYTIFEKRIPQQIGF